MVDKLGAQDHLQRDFVIGMITSDQFMGAVIKHWRDDILSVPELQTIAGWCLDYFKTYGEVPGERVNGIYMEEMSTGRLEKAEAEGVETVLQTISNRYNGYPADAVAAKFLIDQFVRYDRQRQFEDGLASAEGHAKRGDADQAKRDIGQALTRHPLEADDDPEVAMLDAVGQALKALASKDLAGVRVALWTGATVGSSGDLLPDPWADDPIAPPFDRDLLPPVLGNYADVMSRALGCDTGTVAWATIAVCSGALDGQIRLQMKDSDRHFVVPPALWIGLTGPSGYLKSPAIKAATRPLYMTHSNLRQAWLPLIEEWQRQPPGQRGRKPDPCVQLIVNGATPEGMRNALRHQSRGIFLHADELAGFFGSMGRHSGGKHGDKADRAFWNTAYDGGPLDVHLANEHIHVDNLLVALVGGIQNKMVRELNQHGNLTSDGMLQRVLPIVMTETGLGSDVNTEMVTERYQLLIERLVAMPARVLTLTEEAALVRRRVEERLYPYRTSNALGEGFASAINKLHGVFGRLALIIAHVWSPRTPPEVVDLRAAEMAERLMFDSLIPNIASFYVHVLGASTDVELTRAIAALLLKEQRVRITAGDITRGVRNIPERRTDRVREVISPLVTMDWLAPEGQDERRAHAWLVNQDIYVQFAERAMRVKAEAMVARDLIGQTAGPRARKQLCQRLAENVDNVACAGETEFAKPLSLDKTGNVAPFGPRARKQLCQHDQRPVGQVVATSSAGPVVAMRWRDKVTYASRRDQDDMADMADKATPDNHW